MQSIPDMAMLMKLAQSPAGQQLLTMLRSTGGKELDQITADAAAGNMENAGKKLADMLSSQEAKNLLKQLEESL